MQWTKPADIKAQVQKWWDSGELLCDIMRETSQFPRKLKLKGPRSSEIADHFEELRTWITQLRQVPYCRVEMEEVNHRIFGKNEVPSEIWIDSRDNAIALIGKKKEAKKFEELFIITREQQPSLLAWLEKRPLKSLELAEDWHLLLKIISWRQEHSKPDIFLRQVDITGVHSKFIELNKGVLTELLNLALPETEIDATATGVSNFASRFGFKDKPGRIRFRLLDTSLNLLSGSRQTTQDITLDGQSFSTLYPPVSHVFITENEINFLAFPEIKNSMVIFGAGYGFDALARAQWLRQCHIYYWGDIDTHGFSILSSARSSFSHIISLLMDEETLLKHLPFCIEEPSQHPAEELPNLLPDEQNLYRNLKANYWQKNLRLEQERISWSHACEKIAEVLLE
jgi:hypothetical protein